ncbi:uncharacterized protein LOC121682463 isoform X4 [Alosa sapidissima]|uniref:uncharacterized protein LOC121682463 isoform X4 n=1 Tax=Alosa sapidissima TaxID=34773 RepID=UPI001C095EB5|nr:uncharacterized protein LOC121682463 isoform X4 [Alosa sapidissima]
MGIFSGLFRQKRRPTKKFKRDLSYAVLLLCLIKMKNWCSGEAGAPLAFAVWVDFSSESPTFNFTDALGGERPYVDPDISGTHCRMAIGRLIKEHALSQGLSRPEYLPQHRPPWWPEELPFASVSDGKGEGRKAFTAEKLRKVVRSYNAYYNLQLQQSVEAPPSPPSPATPAAATPAAPLTPLNPHPTP